MTPDPDFKGPLHGVIFYPPSTGGVVNIRFKGRVIPILFSSDWDFDGGLGHILKAFGENMYYLDATERDAGEVFFAAFAGGGIGKKRRRFQFVPVNVPNLGSVNPSLANAGESDPSVPLVDMVEISSV